MPALSSGTLPGFRRVLLPLLPVVLFCLSTTACSRHRSNVPSEPKCAQPRDNAPWIVHWPERASLQSAIGDGPVLVRYVGCELEIVPDCHPKRRDAYTYVGREQEKTAELLSDEQQLFRKLPVDAPGLDKERAGADVRLRATVAGVFRTDPHSVRGEELEGKCEDATHLVSGVVVGSYQLSAVRSASDTEGSPLVSEGEPSACEKASTLDLHPPAGCSSPMRLELAPLSKAAPVAESTTPWLTAYRKDGLAKMLTLTTIASLISLGWGAYKVVSSNKTVDDHCAGKACDQEGLNAAKAGKTGAYMVDVGLAGTAVSVLALVLFTGGGYSQSGSDDAGERRARPGAGVASNRIEPAQRAQSYSRTMRLTPVGGPQGVMLGWEARF